jgi:hypothetical protein
MSKRQFCANCGESWEVHNSDGSCVDNEDVQPGTTDWLPEPSLEELMQWENKGGCEATDGCWVEPDGRCHHGHDSWLIVLGLI